MIEIEERDQQQFAGIVAFAKRHHMVPKLCRTLEYLGKYASNVRETKVHETKCVLGYDFAPQSMGFAMHKLVDGEWKYWFNGGLIYQGPLDDDKGVILDGSFTSLTVSLDNRIGWGVHT